MTLCRRKYRKLRHQFKEVMRQSDELFKQEQLATLAIRRLNEENTYCPSAPSPVSRSPATAY